jgi:preprotein translocase subunit SecE
MANKVGNFFQEATNELKKVTWPPMRPWFSAKTELWGSTYVVIVLTVIMAAFIGAVDFVLTLIGSIGARIFGV